MKTPFTLLIFLLFMVSGMAQIPPNPYLGDPPEIRSNLIFERVEIDGKPVEFSFHTMVEDEKGFLWFASQGLLRYDGRQFKRYDPVNYLGVPMEPGSYGTWGMCLDHQGIIWLATHGQGLQRFDPKTESFSVFNLSPNNSSVSKTHVIWNSMEDSKHRLWVGTRGEGLYMINAERDSVVNFRHDPNDLRSISSDRVTYVIEDSKNRIWAGTQFAGMNLLHEQSKNFTRILFESEEGTKNASNFIGFSVETDKAQLWITTWNGLVILDPDNLTYRRYLYDPNDPFSLSSNALRGIILDSRNNIMISSEKGINVFDPRKGFIHLKSDKNNPNALLSNYITISRGIQEDKVGTLWISTGGGMSKVDAFTNNFEFLALPDYLERRQEASSIISGIFHDQSEKLWLIADNIGLYRFDPQTGKTELFQHRTDNSNSLSSNAVWDLVQDQTGTIWTSSIAGLDFYDPNKGYFQRYCQVYPEQCKLFDRPSCLKVDQDGSVWMGGNGSGLYHLDPINRKLTQYPYEPDNPNGLGIHLIVNIVEDQFGNFWMNGEGGGLHWFNPRTEKFIRFKSTDQLPKGLSLFNIPMLADQEGLLWFWTSAGPLSVQANEEAQLKLIKLIKIPGLGKRYDLVKNKQGELWISYGGKIAAFDPDHGPGPSVILPRDVRPDVVQYQNNARFFERAPSGEIYLAAESGLYRFHPDRYQKNTTPPPVVLTEIKLSNKTVPIRGTTGDSLEEPSPLLQSIAYARSLDLAYRQNEFSLEFAALSFSQPENNQYKYLLENYKADTVYTTSDRAFANFTNLDPGNYTFKVWGSNHHGVWSSQPTTLDIRINPPWWQTWWARSIFGLLIITGLYLIRRFELRKQRKKLEVERAFNRQLQNINQANQRFVPQGFLEILGKKDITDLKLGDQIQTKMTVLFSDIRDYTTLSESMSPEDNFKFINGYLGRVGPLIEKHGGFIGQYFGDGLMALFLKDHTAAVKAALDIQKELHQYNQQRKARARPPINTGIGLNTGQLMLGIIGDRNRYDSTVISDAVNTASRMEGLTKVFGGSIILSEKTLVELEHKELFQYRFLGKIKVKGKDQAISIYDLYDGEPKELRQLKATTKSDFEQAIYLYFDKQFGQAADLFKIVLEKNPNDLAANYYFEKALQYITDGVDASWDGVEKMLIK